MNKNIKLIKTVMVVDDEQEVCRAIERILELEGYETLSFYSIENAIKYLRENVNKPPEVIFTDYKLKGMKTGIDFIKYVKENFKLIKIILMTGYGDKMLVVDCLKNGVDDYIDKPISMNSIKQSLSNIEKKLASPDFICVNKIEEKISSTIHELKNRLQGIKAIADLNEEIKCEDKNMIKSEMNKINDILCGMKKDILKNNLVNLNLTENTIKDIIEYSIKVVMSNANQRNIEIINNTGLEKIKCDYNKMIQVFVNLLLNAILYTNENSSVIINSSKENGDLYISISDSGKTIPAEMREKIFEKNFRISDSPNGTGWGLYITRDILKSHNAEIFVEENQPAGNIFKIRMRTNGN